MSTQGPFSFLRVLSILVCTVLLVSIAHADGGYSMTGWVANLPHDDTYSTDGTATIIDAQTIRVDNFSYDGRAPDVLFYLAVSRSNADLSNGIAISAMLDRAYSNETVELTVPAGVDLSVFHVLSVWCRSFAVDLSSAPFLPTIPQSPNDLMAMAEGEDSIRLDWSHPGGASEFRIDRSVEGGFEVVDLVGAESCSYLDSGLSPGETYEYQVIAVNSAGSSQPSPGASATTEMSAVPTSVLLPALARLQGSTAFFTSRLDLANVGEQSFTIELEYTPREDIGGATRHTELELQAGESRTIVDPLEALFGVGDGERAVGSLRIDHPASADGSFKAQSVVFARLEDGREYGQFFPVATAADLLGAGESAWLATTESAHVNRVNVGVSAAVDGTRVKFELHPSVGEALGETLMVDLEAGESEQINDIFAAFGQGPIDNCLVHAEVISGEAAVYASALDGHIARTGSSDPTTIAPVRAGSSRVTLLEIGPFLGLVEFSGSAMVANLSDAAVLIQADFHSRGQAGVTKSTNLELPVGGTTGYSDLVGDLFGLSNTVGTVVFSVIGEGEISVTGREFSVTRDEGGEVVATVGQAMPGLVDADLVPADTEVHLIGLFEGEGIRTHFAAFNPGNDAATIELELFDASGASRGTEQLVVEGQQLIQIDFILRRFGPLPEDFSRLELVSDRPVFVNAFQVNASDDPITIEAQ